ncbi:cupin domain-containing protein [Bordetella trematum]|uniref:hypothetical protein n=1 Tax=Bordetella trematum TaxID=123899 RepID=UPI00398A1941
MIRCVRLWTGADKESHFEDGWLDLPKGERGDVLSEVFKTASISFRETNAGGSYSWHEAPARQFVITLSGTLEFETRSGSTFILHPGDILLAEDTTGEGHRWRLTDQQPWRRAYVILAPDASIPFVPAEQAS